MSSVRTATENPASAPGPEEACVSRLAGLADAPIVVSPVGAGQSVAQFVTDHGPWLKAALHKSGAILFRGFAREDIDGFDRFMRLIAGPPLAYTNRSSPRTQVKGNIYTSTEYPPEQAIPFHTEMSYTRTWPMAIGFMSVKVAATGGETPMADCRRVYDRIPDVIRRRFEEKGVMYVRNYRPGIDLSWKTVFQAATREEVERFCRMEGIEAEWIDADHLRTRHVCQGVATHPVTREKVWMNQAHLFHVTSLDPDYVELLLEEFGEENLPRNTYYGDGSRIEPEALAAIRAAYAAEALVFPWQENDILLLDNMLMAHGRSAFTGERKVVVGMADAYSPA